MSTADLPVHGPARTMRQDAGSGIASYDIYVSDNSAAYALWKDDITDTSATFTGQNGHTYAFYYVALDNVGHIEAAPGVADALTLVMDNQPPTDITLSNAGVAENQPSGTVVGTLSTTDPDSGDTFTYTLVGGDTGAFSVDGDMLKTAASFDYEAKNSYSIEIRATDSGSPALSYDEIFTISVTNVNEQPLIGDQVFSIAENSVNGTVVGTVTASDPDGNSLTYSITDGNTSNAFSINPATGQLTVAISTALDYEITSNFGLTIQAADDGTPALSKTATITVNLINVNEGPTVALATTTGSLAENTDTSIRIRVADIVVTDDALGTNELSLSGADAAMFEIDGAVLYLKAGVALSYPTNPQLNVTVAVDDPAVGATPDSTAPLSIAVLDTTAPTSQVSALPAQVRTASFTVSWSGQDSGTGIASYDIYVSDNGGAFGLWLDHTAQTSATFTGQDGHTYAFYSVAKDNAGNTEAPPATPDAQTTVRLNHQPNAIDDSFVGYEDHALTSPAPGLLSNDTDADGDPLTAIKVTNPGHGHLTLNPDGSFAYWPEANWWGTDSFTYKANDGQADSNTATVTLVVCSVNDAPSFTLGPDPVAIEDAGLQTLVHWVTGISAGPANESSQALSFIVTCDTAALFSVQPAISPDGTLTFTPAHNMYGWATVTVRLQDNGGTVNGGVDTSVAKSFMIRVYPGNDAPVLDNTGTMWLSSIRQGDTDNPGTLVTDILASAGGDRITDVDAGAVEGIAVIGASSGSGTWQFSTDSGKTWMDLGSPSPSQARLLAADAYTRVRFIPKAGFFGRVDPGITLRAWDQTSRVQWRHSQCRTLRRH